MENNALSRDHLLRIQDEDNLKFYRQPWSCKPEGCESVHKVDLLNLIYALAWPIDRVRRANLYRVTQHRVHRTEMTFIASIFE